MSSDISLIFVWSIFGHSGCCIYINTLSLARLPKITKNGFTLFLMCPKCPFPLHWKFRDFFEISKNFSFFEIFANKFSFFIFFTHHTYDLCTCLKISVYKARRKYVSTLNIRYAQPEEQPKKINVSNFSVWKDSIKIFSLFSHRIIEQNHKRSYVHMILKDVLTYQFFY